MLAFIKWHECNSFPLIMRLSQLRIYPSKRVDMSNIQQHHCNRNR